MANSIIYTLEEIEQKWKNGDYKVKINFLANKKPYESNHIFDDNQSVKWNKEQVAIENEKIEKSKAEYREDKIILEGRFTNDIIAALMNSYGFNFKQAQKIENRVYSDHHHDMINNYFFYLADTADFINEINKLK